MARTDREWQRRITGKRCWKAGFTPIPTWPALRSRFLESLQFIQQRAAADAEGFRGLGTIEFVFAKRQQDRLAFDVLELAADGGRRGSPLRGRAHA